MPEGRRRQKIDKCTLLMLVTCRSGTSAMLSSKVNYPAGGVVMQYVCPACSYIYISGFRECATQSRDCANSQIARNIYRPIGQGEESRFTISQRDLS